jgi:hypothetical protein
MEDPISLASILDSQLEWIPDEGGPPCDGGHLDPHGLADGPPVSSVLAEPERALILRAGATKTIALIRDHLDYRGNSRRVSKMQVGNISMHLGWLYEHILMVARKRDRPKPRPGHPLDGFCIVDLSVLLRNGWITAPVHLAYIELHAMFKALTCPSETTTQDEYWSIVLGSLETIVKVLPPIHESSEHSQPPGSVLRQRAIVPPESTEKNTAASGNSMPEVAATSPVNDSGPTITESVEPSDRPRSPWTMTVPPKPEKHVLELDGCSFDLDDEDVLLHLSEHINRSRTKTPAPAASGRKNRPLGDPASQAIAAALSLHKQGKPVSVRSACKTARVDRNHLADKYRQAVELIKKLSLPDRKPPMAKWDRRTRSLEAVDDSDDE